MIKFDNVCKKYSFQTVALDKISLSIDDGEFIFLVGPSGAGKTTLLRLITGDLLPTSGRIFMDKVEINKLSANKIPQLRRKITMIFQDFKVLTDRTVFENVSLALEILGLPDKEIHQKVDKTLSLVGLEEKKRHFPSQLSAGELQRVSIARAVVGRPKVLLADEPTGNLDAKNGWDIIKLLTDINKYKTTIIMATHNMDIVNSMKRRVIVLNNGRLIRDQKEGKYSS